MKKIPILFIFILLLTLIPLSNIVNASDTRYEYFDNTQSIYFDVYGNRWGAETFTVGTVGTNESFRVTSIKFQLLRLGTVSGNIYIHIRNSTAFKTGTPTGTDFGSGSMLASTVSAVTPTFYEVSITSSYFLHKGTTYSICLNISGGDASHCINMEGRKNTLLYAGGTYCTSGDGGSSWSSTSANDFFFYTYGKTNALPTISLISPTNSSTAISKPTKCSIYANDSDGGTLTVTWRSNYTGSYVTYNVNSSFTANTICRYTFTGMNTQYKKYYWKVYVFDGTDNISKWFCYTTALCFMNISYSGLNPVNNTDYNYAKNYTLIATTLLSTRTYLFNLSFTKTCLQGFNTTTKIYANKSLLTTYTFINGSKTIDMLALSGKTFYNGFTYSWSINTTFYNLSYNRTYYFTLHIIMNNVPNTTLTVYNNTHNVTGKYQTSYSLLTGNKIWMNYTGIKTSCGNTSLTVYNNTVNVTGKYQTSYDSLTGNKIWLNFTGINVSVNVSGITEDDFITSCSSVFLFTIIGLFVVKRRKRKL